jgi:cytochrome c-type biogenesis protein CcsB
VPEACDPHAHHSKLPLRQACARAVKLALDVDLLGIAPGMTISEYVIIRACRAREAGRQRKGAAMTEAHVPASLGIYDFAMFGYFAAYLAYAFHAFFDRRPIIGRIATGLTAVAFVLHSTFMVERAIFYYHQHQGFVLPATNMFEAISYFAFLTVLSYLIIECTLFKSAIFGVFAMLIPVAAMAFTARSMSQDPRELMPSLKSYWLVFHVTAMFISYAVFALAFTFAIMYLVRLSGKALERIDTRFNLKWLDETSYKLVLFAFPILTLGIFLGAVWANSAWGRYWGWDPKETWALITWIIYLAYLHLRMQWGWIGYRSALLNIIGFCAVLVTFLGVNLLDSAFKLGSIHAYAEGGSQFMLIILGLAILIPLIMLFLPTPEAESVKRERRALRDGKEAR